MIVLGQKKIMTQILNRYSLVPVTVVDITDAVVAGKVELPDGTKAILVGYGKKKQPNKPELGKFKELGYVPEKVVQVSVSSEEFDSYKIGDSLVDTIEIDKGKKVKVTGTSKGKGFTGVVKRWGFGGGPKTHGQSDRHRAIGAIGSQTPGRVFKGKKMAGRSGNARVTIPNVEVVDKVVEEGRTLLLLKGPTPGNYDSILMIRF